MAEHYHDENDLKLMREMRKLAPDDFNAWLGLNNIVGRENGAIPRKYRELKRSNRVRGVIGIARHTIRRGRAWREPAAMNAQVGRS